MTKERMRVVFYRSSVAVLFLFAVLTMSSAWAMNMHCNCANQSLNGQSLTKSGTTYNLTCKGSFSAGADSSSSDYNKWVKIYYTEGSSSDQEVGIKVRPREGSQCLTSVYDQNKNSRWTGLYCDTSEEKKVSGFKMEKSTSASGSVTYNIAGSANTTSHQNTFIGIYTLASSTYKLIGACVED